MHDIQGHRGFHVHDEEFEAITEQIKKQMKKTEKKEEYKGSS